MQWAKLRRRDTRLAMWNMHCRTLLKAQDLAAAVGEGAEAVPIQDVESGAVSGDVLVNTTSIGMHPDEDATPVPRAALSGYGLVFDAVYTPLETRLLKVRPLRFTDESVTWPTWAPGSLAVYS
jgi:shikimate 5-dehydrogenase